MAMGLPFRPFPQEETKTGINPLRRMQNVSCEPWTLYPSVGFCIRHKAINKKNLSLLQQGNSKLRLQKSRKLYISGQQ